jgi:PAS domain S-box-containing protein
VDTCRALRATPSTAGVPILLVTAPVDNDEVLRGLSAGIDDYLIKPFVPALLTARIASLVRTKRHRERDARDAENARAERALAVDRERIEAALRRSEAWLAMTLQSVGDGLIATDDAGRVVFMNPIATQLTGWTIDDAKGRPLEAIFDIVNETTRDPVENPVAKVLREGTLAGLANHTVLRSKDGSEVAIDDSAAPIRDEHGRLFGVVLVFRDVSEARRKDAELRTFRAVVDASTDFIAFGRPGGRPDYVNPAGLRLVGLASQEAARALSLADYYTPETRDTTLATMIPLIRAEHAFHGRTVLRHFETGEPIPVSQSAFAVQDEHGSTVVLAAILRDQREQQRADSEREALLAREKQARGEAIAERQKLHDLFMQAPVPIAIMKGPEHTFTLANPAYRALVGDRDVVGKPLRVALPDLEGQGFDVLLDHVVASGKPFFGSEVEIKLAHHAEGEALILNFVYTPKRDAEGRVEGVLVSATNVTEQVRARDRAESLATQLRESEERVRRVVEASGAGLWDLDVATGHIGADARLIELMGLPPGSMMSLESALDSIHHDEREGVAAAVAAALAGENGGRYHVEFRSAATKSAPRRWVESRAQVLFDAAGKAAYLAGAMMDITARKHAELARQSLLEEIQRSEESFRTLAEAIPQQVWTSRPDGALDFVNQRVLAYFDRTREQILGAGWQAVTHPEDLPGVVARWAHSLVTGDEYEVEFRLRRADGTYRWNLGRAVVVRGARGEIIKWFGTNTDIDDAKRIREELEERNRFEQHLLGIVSHDLRNPIGAILLGATGLLDLEESDDVTSIARRIHASAERSTRMIRDLLDFTQARRGGRIRLLRRSVDLHELAIATIIETKASYPGRVVELTREGNTQGAWDADRLAQVIINLVTNALKYSPTGTPVAVRVRDRGDAVELDVHNDGAPIPADRLGQIFSPLQRATDEIDLVTRSVGLGLYIVDAIVKAHGGTVGVVSTASAGTAFTVRLPRQGEPEPQG